MWPFQAKAAPERRPDDTPIVPQVVYLSNGSAIGIVRWSEAIAVEQAMRHPVVYRALDKIASSVQQVGWYAELDPAASDDERRGKDAFIRDLQSLLDHPSPDMTPAMLRYWMGLNYAAYGRVAMKIGFRATAPDTPNGIYPLEARQVFARLDSRAVATEYEYGTGQAKQAWPGKARASRGEAFVEQIWRPGLKGYQHRDDANTALQAVGLPAQVIKSLLMRAVQTAEGHPNVRYLVTCAKTLTATQVDALRQHLNDDHGLDGAEAGRIPILQNAGEIEIHRLENDLSDIHSKMPSDDMARLIFGAFGIPIALAGMGAADAAKFAGNYIESRSAFWEDTIIPGYVEPLFQGLSRMLCPPGVRIRPDLDTIPAIASGRIAAMAKMKDVDFLTANEKREIFGWGPQTGDVNA